MGLSLRKLVSATALGAVGTVGESGNVAAPRPSACTEGFEPGCELEDTFLLQFKEGTSPKHAIEAPHGVPAVDEPSARPGQTQMKGKRVPKEIVYEDVAAALPTPKVSHVQVAGSAEVATGGMEVANAKQRGQKKDDETRGPFKVTVYDSCIGCTQCVRACPTDVFDMVPGPNKAGQVAFPARVEDCVGCHRCESACPTAPLSVRVKAPWDAIGARQRAQPSL